MAHETPPQPDPVADLFADLRGLLIARVEGSMRPRGSLDENIAAYNGLANSLRQLCDVVAVLVAARDVAGVRAAEGHEATVYAAVTETLCPAVDALFGRHAPETA